MADGLNEYHHDPMRWAVGTVLEGNKEVDGHSAEDLVENVWEFIVSSFELENLPLPSKARLVKEVKVRLQER